MSDHIPPEIIEEIFLRLPVKSVIKLSCVCKLWYSLISSPSFISLYTHFTTFHNTNNSIFIIRRFSKVQAREIFTLNYDCNDGDDDSSKLLVQYRLLNFPFKSSFGCFQIVGSCYGLLCLIENNFEETASFPKPIILWNPSVGNFVTVPVKHSGDYSSSCESIIGFGYDSSRSDYKVVRIARCFRDYSTRLNTIEVDIFEVSVGAWRSIMSLESSYVITGHSPQAFLNGAIHWIGYKHPNEALGVGGKLVVAVFNVVEEVFGELEMPDEIATARFINGRSKTTVSVFGRSLCLMRYCSEEQWQHHPCYELCHVWVMKEYGVAQSWIKMYTICPWGGFSKALGLRRNGEILLMTSYGEMVSYDPESQMISPLEIHGESSSFYLDSYTESLFLWKGNKVLSGKKSSSIRISV